MTITISDTKYEHGYEDDYEGLGFEHSGELLGSLESTSATDSPFAPLNVPVWINAPDSVWDVRTCKWCAQEDGDCGEHRLSVGMLLTRKGRTVIWWADAWTQDDVQAIRQLMLSVWANRADSGFARYRTHRDED
jgi:hypothetical protein